MNHYTGDKNCCWFCLLEWEKREWAALRERILRST